jgi:PhnB protein
MNINPYLKFNDDKCREAMAFYKNALGGELSFQTIGESAMANEVPKEGQNKIMHSTLKKGSVVILYGADMM